MGVESFGSSTRVVGVEQITEIVMHSLRYVLILLVLATGSTFAQDLTFKKTRSWSNRVRRRNRSQLLRCGGKIAYRFPSRKREIAYADLKKLNGEYSKHGRVASAILLTPWTLFSRPKHHWFTIEYSEAEGKGNAVLLLIGKREELTYIRALPSKTGVEFQDIIED